ncbi:MAG TPA: FAD-dependent oxidoreductase, partial [Candidatus Sulfotelmatobacter sp.]|nr:FAD-dependent oxidoreductase [Candidatus Sulfotelmatobacter sp.]
FRQHLAQFKFELREGEAVSKVEKLDKGFKVSTAQGAALEAGTVIIATGKRPRLLGVPGEGKYGRKGVTYCATCDGPLFANKAVAVIGGGNSALDAALQMIKIAGKVYLINIAPQLTGDPVMIDKVKADPKVEVLNGTKTLEFFGDQFLKGIKVESGGAARELAIEGAFIEIGLVPNSGCIDFVDKNEIGEIVVNNLAETSCPGVYAAGDVTNMPEKQIVIAAGDGAKALLIAFGYICTH